MYRCIILWCTLCSVFAQEKLSAQHVNRVISEQFDTEIFDFGRLSDGKWIFAVKISPLPDALADISLAVIITDSLGVQIKTIPVPIIFPGERFEISDLFVLPNDEFLVMDRGGDCDSDLRNGALQKLDTTGSVLWSVRSNANSYMTPSGITADGSIIGFYGKRVRSILTSTGTLLWESNIDSIPFKSILIMPGTDNLLVGDAEGLKIYKKDTVGADIKYILKHSQDIPTNSGFITQLVADGDGLFYALKSDTREIIRFRDDLVPEVILTCPAYTYFFPKPNGLVLTKYESGIIQEYSIYDTLWVKMDSIKIDWPGVKSRWYGAFDDGLAMVGKYTSGANTSYYPDDLYYSGRREGWFGFYKDYNLHEIEETISISIKEIIEQDSIIIDSFYSPGPDYTGYIYSFSGGKFKVKILNTGNQPVDSFWLNTVFNEWTNYWFCAPASATQRKYIIPKLFPGDSTWIEFGDFDAILQRVLPVNFCFWTSGPDQHPDDIPEDDIYCFNSKLHRENSVIKLKKFWTEGMYQPEYGWRSRKFRFDTIPEIKKGKTYFTLERSYTESGEHWITISSPLLRESNNVIYKYVETYNDEEVLYDFNLIEGDTFHLDNGLSGQNLIVTKVDSVQLLNGENKKRLLLEAINPLVADADANHIIWIEGIGNINGLMTNYLPWSAGTESFTLLCMHWDSVLVYDNPDFDACWLQTTATKEIDNQKIYFIPNPATEEITLMGYKSDLEEIKIFNSNGQMVLTGRNNVINISDLPAGYYYATIQLKNGQFKNVGFVKM